MGKNTLLSYTIQHFFQISNGAIDVLELVQTEQTYPEGTEICRFVAFQRHAGGYLQTLLGELLTGVDVLK